jgi:hypothetical protein
MVTLGLATLTLRAVFTIPPASSLACTVTVCGAHRQALTYSISAGLVLEESIHRNPHRTHLGVPARACMDWYRRCNHCIRHQRSHDHSLRLRSDVDTCFVNPTSPVPGLHNHVMPSGIDRKRGIQPRSRNVIPKHVIDINLHRINRNRCSWWLPGYEPVKRLRRCRKEWRCSLCRRNPSWDWLAHPRPDKN